MATAYKDYQPLDESQRQIRLITLHAEETPGHGDSEAVVTCTLETVALRHANPFYGLSYVWGPSTPTAALSIDGQIIHVRRNLWLFLDALRERFCRNDANRPSGRASIRVWADYVCIQQNNIRERNFQVAMMGDVYNAADAVYSWLGEPTMPVDDGMRCIAEIAALREQHASWSQIRRQVGSIETRVWSLSTSEYWNRMWIKQEALLAKDLWFFLGKNVAHWQDIWFAIQLCPPRTKHPSQVLSFRAMLSLLQAREHRMMQFELHDLVERFADARCQDPRDRIYAMLALVDHKTSRQIVVDYQKPVLQVLLENYPYWTNGAIVRPLKDKIVPDKLVYHTGHFCKVIHGVLPSAEFGALCDSQNARREITAQGVFVATDLSSVEWVCPIATIGATTIDPVIYFPEAGNGKTAFILRVSLRPCRSGKGALSRQCFVYSDVVPKVDSLVVWTGSRVLFFQLSGESGNIGEDKVDRPKHLSLIGTGAEIRERGLTTGVDRLSRRFLFHPCLWLKEQLDDARFAIHTSGDWQKYNNITVICNAAAMILLLREYARDQNASAQDQDGSNLPGSNQAKLWSPYTFGIEHKLLQPCQLCRSTGRSAALTKRPESAGERWPSCDCRWISRTDCGDVSFA